MCPDNHVSKYNAGLAGARGYRRGHVRGRCNPGSVVTVVGGVRLKKSDLSVYNPSHLVPFIFHAYSYGLYRV